MASKQSLYPDILFHFTSKDGLWGILRETFSVSYASERIVGNSKSTEFSTPMVSFCDLKISELKAHIEKYGNYGIGLTKDWANKNGLNPVFYVNRHSPFTSDFIRAVEELYKQLNGVKGIINKVLAEKTYMNILNTYRYIKNYEGDLVRRNGKKTRNYRFADEGEWRFVPPLNANTLPFVPAKNISTPQMKENYNKNISHIKLSFQPEDIKYLIVESENEITGLIQHLSQVKGRFDVKTRQRLASRILTVEQIHNDV